MKWWTWVRVWTIVLVVAGLVVWIGLRLAWVEENASSPVKPLPAVSKHPTFLLTGTASCSARGCHGSLRPPANVTAEAPVQFDEYTRWNNRDPHTRAYQVLLEDRSNEIAKNLKIQVPHEDPRCLACHVNPSAIGKAAERLLEDAPNSEPARQLLEERLIGVGCETCHGPAERWLGPHTTNTWKTADKKALGMKLMEDVVTRGQVCAGCHVGAPPGPDQPLRDVNHDLIAAGHPRLQFELGTFLANLPPHWNVRAKKAQAASDAQTWALGQVVSAEAALELLAHRAAPPQEKVAPWPEFAEYNCFACHHDLQPNSWRQRPKVLGKRKPGTLPWGSWYFSLAAKLSMSAETKGLASLTASMAKPYPSRQTVKQQAQEALIQLAALRKRLEREPLDREALRKLLTVAVKEGGEQFVTNWEVAEQLFLAAQVLQSQPGGAAVHQLRAFPRGFESPHGFRPDFFLKALQLD